MTPPRPRLALGLPVGESLYKSDEQFRILDLARAAGLRRPAPSCPSATRENP